MIIEIPFKTPTINHLYYHRGNIKILKPEGRKLREEIAKIVQAIPFDLKESYLKIEVEIYEDWFFKNGKIATKDIANREKFLIDSIFKALELDDKLIFETRLKKCQSQKEEKAVVKIWNTTLIGRGLL